MIYPLLKWTPILRSVADCFKEDIRAGVDIAARMDDQDFLIAMPGSPLKKAEEIAAQVKNEISERVKAPEAWLLKSLQGLLNTPLTRKICHYSP